MMKTIACAVLALGMSMATAAENMAATNLDDMYFSGKNPTLTRQEREAMQMAKKWMASGASTEAASAAAPGRDGWVRFAFGTQQPSIVCAVMQVCDVALQPGEQVNSLHVGDSARWSIEPALTGSGATEVQHLIIKPMDVGLETSLIVTTNRRSYHLRLRSHRTEYMPQVSFTYPQEEATQRWALMRVRAEAVKEERQERTIPETGEYLGALNFGYDIAGDAPWKPLRVYNDGKKTVIQMPASMAQTEAPSLLVVTADGSDELGIVNYRLHGDRFIVDQVFKKAVLIAGVGSSQQRITITKEDQQ